MNWVSGIILVFVILWVVSGNAGKTVTGWFWPDSNAPWEKVNAFYYPDSSNLYEDQRAINVGGLQECRSWVMAQAALNGDSELERGDYECGIGCYSEYDGEIWICRLTIR